MKFNFFLITILCYVCNQNIKAQCPPSAITTTINGFYTNDINPIVGTAIYIAPTATVTGNINLINSSLYNCGLILSPKIVMKKSASIFQITLDNNGIIKTDSIVMDSLSHFHNNDTLICKYIEVKNGAQASNLWVMELGTLSIRDQSLFDTNGKITASTIEIKGPSSSFYNQYGSIVVKKLFKNAATCNFHGVIFMCVDSCFINNGIINSSAMTSWHPFINVSGQSLNTGQINSPNFCDMSSVNGGMLDVNTGTVTITSYCAAQQYSCDYYASIKENNNVVQFNVYPIPSSSILNIIDEQNLLLNSTIEIKNYLGEIVLTTLFTSQINISSLSSGMYFLTLQDKVNQTTIKFIKE
jgi:hypothetical protein